MELVLFRIAWNLGCIVIESLRLVEFSLLTILSSDRRST